MRVSPAQAKTPVRPLILVCLCWSNSEDNGSSSDSYVEESVGVGCDDLPKLATNMTLSTRLAEFSTAFRPAYVSEGTTHDSKTPAPSHSKKRQRTGPKVDHRFATLCGGGESADPAQLMKWFRLLHSLGGLAKVPEANFTVAQMEIFIKMVRGTDVAGQTSLTVLDYGKIVSNAIHTTAAEPARRKEEEEEEHSGNTDLQPTQNSPQQHPRRGARTVGVGCEANVDTSGSESVRQKGLNEGAIVEPFSGLVLR